MTEGEKPSEETPRPPRRWWRRLRRIIVTAFFLVLFVGLLGWAYTAWVNREADRQTATVLANLHQRMLPESLEQVLADSPAGARPPARYLYAAAELEPNFGGYRDLPYMGQVSDPNFGQPIPANLAKRLAAFVTDNADYFALLTKAEAADERQQLLSFEDERRADRLNQLRAATMSRATASLAAQSAGDANEAMRQCAKALWLGSTFDGQQIIVHSLIRGGCDSLTAGVINQCLSRGEASPNSLRAVREKLRHEIAAVDFAEIASADVALTAEMMTDMDLCMAIKTQGAVESQRATEQAQRELIRMRKAADAASVWPGVSRGAVRRELALQWTWNWLCPGSYRLTGVEGLRSSLAGLDRASKSDAELAQWANRTEDPNSKTHVGFTPQLVHAVLGIKARLAVASAALGVEMYRMEHGAWPEDIAAVSDVKVVDPFTGKPLKYARTPEGVKVYSVGQNLADDGGKPDRPGKGDIVFRLLDPDKRNKP